MLIFGEGRKSGQKVYDNFLLCFAAEFISKSQFKNRAILGFPW